VDELEVVCVDYETYPGGGSRIFRLGIGGGNTYIEEEATVMRNVRTGHRYFVKAGGSKAYLTIGISERGNAFVETVADRTTLDNLGSLPGCLGDRPAPHRPSSGVPEDPNDVDAGFDGGDVDPGGSSGDVDQP
jgi:hypothetical protein